MDRPLSEQRASASVSVLKTGGGDGGAGLSARAENRSLMFRIGVDQVDCETTAF